MRVSAALGPVRQFGTVAVVAAVCGAYGGFLVMCSVLFTASSQASGAGGLAAILAVVAAVFILISVYVSAVVIANCVDTVLAGMLHQIALLRLLGATRATLRSLVTGRTTLLASVAAAAGVLVGAGAALVLRIVLVDHGVVPGSARYPWLSWWLTAPLLATCATTYLATRIGTRGVLDVSPVAAMRGGVSDGTAHGLSRWRRGVSLTAFGSGGLLLGLSMWIGEVGGTALGFPLAFLGAATTGTGLLVGARLMIPAVVSCVGRALGGTPPSLIARRNAVRNPLRTTRATMGLVIGVTLVTTFASGLDALRDSVGSWETSPEQQQRVQSVLSTTSAVLTAVIVVSALISAIGFASTMSLSVTERTREIGLLHALGFTRRQIRAMIVREAAAVACGATALGLALGLVFGSGGAQALVGFQTPGFVWGVPWAILATITGATVVLVLLASMLPARRAVRLAPVVALRT